MRVYLISHVLLEKLPGARAAPNICRRPLERIHPPLRPHSHHNMASLLKEKSVKKADAKGKRKADDMEVDQQERAPAAKKPRNKQRVLMLSSRGINHRMRHLMNDLEVLLPHVKKGECTPSSDRMT